MRETGRDESQSVPSPDSSSFFRGSLPNCWSNSAGYTCIFLHPYFTMAKTHPNHANDRKSNPTICTSIDLHESGNLSSEAGASHPPYGPLYTLKYYVSKGKCPLLARKILQNTGNAKRTNGSIFTHVQGVTFFALLAAPVWFSPMNEQGFCPLPNP